MTRMKKHLRVGIGVYILRDGKVLFGKRIGSHGTGTWSAPGGWLEFGKSWDECAKREAFEEAGVKIKKLRFGTVTNDISEEEKEHVVTIHVVADWKSEEAKIMEPEKWEKWSWVSWDELPQPLFYPYKNLFKQKFNPFEK